MSLSTGIFGEGALIENDYSSYVYPYPDTIGVISITNSDFSLNGNTGLNVITYGSIVLKKVSANLNRTVGVILNNSGATVAKPVSVTSSFFDGNNLAAGLSINSKGAIKLTNVRAANNSKNWEYIEFGDFITEEVVSGAYSDYWNYENGQTGDTLTFVLSRLEGSPAWDPRTELYQEIGTDWITLDWDSVNVDGDQITYQITLAQDGLVQMGISSYYSNMGGFYSLKFWEGTDPGVYYEINNNINGVEIFNGEGAGVTVNNSNPDIYNFNFNLGSGLWLETKGSVNLSGISALTNKGIGIQVNNAVSGGGKVTCMDCTSNNNRGIGLMIESQGPITLINIRSSQNVGYGGLVYNHTGSTGTPPISIINDIANTGSWTNGFKENIGGGLNIISRGVVTLTNVEVSNNHNNGATIENLAAGAYDVNINNCYFDDNNWDDSTVGYGLHITTLGNILLNKGSASGNFQEGARLDNYNSQSLVTRPISISNFNFDDNGDYGLIALSNGLITAKNLSANGNNGNGATLNNQTGIGGINLLVTSGKKNQFSDNGGYGLHVNTNSAVVLNQTSVLNNAEYGVTIINQNSSTGAGVTINNCEMNGNGNLGNGLSITTKGKVLINNLVASDNAGSGLSISDMALV